MASDAGRTEDGVAAQDVWDWGAGAEGDGAEDCEGRGVEAWGVGGECGGE